MLWIDRMRWNSVIDWKKKKLAGRIATSPLVRFDADVVCKEQWMASIKYCLPITRFTLDQCHQLSIPIEKALPPKLGFNRHIPKTVLYGPHKYGDKHILTSRKQIWPTSEGGG